MDAQQWADFADPIMDALIAAKAVDEFSLAWEMNLWNQPGQELIAALRHCGDKAHAAGLTSWQHFSPHYTSWQANDDDRGRFGCTTTWPAPSMGSTIKRWGRYWSPASLQARIVDTLWLFGQRGNDFKFRMEEDYAAWMWDADEVTVPVEDISATRAGVQYRRRNLVALGVHHGVPAPAVEEPDADAHGYDDDANRSRHPGVRKPTRLHWRLYDRQRQTHRRESLGIRERRPNARRESAMSDPDAARRSIQTAQVKIDLAEADLERALAALEDVPTVPTKQVLQPPDIRYLGPTYVPEDVPNAIRFGYSRGALTYRLVDGHIHFLMCGATAETGWNDPVYEFTYAGVGQRGVMVHNWGDVTKGRRTTAAGTPTRRFTGCCLTRRPWYPLWTYLDGYNVTGAWDPCLGVSALDPSGVRAAGPWRLGDHSQRVGGYLVPRPGGGFAAGAPIGSGNYNAPWARVAQCVHVAAARHAARCARRRARHDPHDASHHQRHRPPTTPRARRR